ncbi:MAG: dTMP kinase [Alphaproteobacteria bacterium]|nr:dTMP kinase [Alphaproteobacteria bacterium]
MAGRFITLEGGEGTGKSTQVKLLAEYLSAKGCEVLTTREPGGTELGAEIRKLLVCGDTNKMDATAEALLYFADRHIHLSQKIWPALENGKVVISDRFADSTFAYQCYGYGQRVKREVLEQLYMIAAGDFRPDLTIILDIDPRIGLERSFAKAQGEAVKELRFENQELRFHENLRQGFKEIAALEPQRCAVVDANRDIEVIHRDIAHIVHERLGL